MTGYFGDTVFFGDYNLTSVGETVRGGRGWVGRRWCVRLSTASLRGGVRWRGYQDIFVLKADPTGNVSWAVSWGNTSTDSGVGEGGSREEA